MTERSLRVLVVEDDHLMRRIFARALGRLDIAAEVVADGDAAVAAVEHSDFTLALVDLHLAGEDGSQVVARVRAAARNPMRYVCISGSVSEVGPASAGFDGYDAKPATVAQMKSLVERWS